MNPRIREFADKAGRYRSHNGGINGGPNPALLHGDENIQKFAQLIIQKCIEEAGDPADGLILDDTWHDGVRASVWSIQQYFGIEHSTHNIP